MAFEKLASKGVAAVFAGIAFIGGFLITDRTLTGNAVLNEADGAGLLNIIGLGLIMCSVILAYFVLKKE